MTHQNTDAQLALEAEIMARLKPVCSDWPESLFLALVKSIATISGKYDHGAKANRVYDPRVTEMMVSDMKVLMDRSAEIRQEL